MRVCADCQHVRVVTIPIGASANDQRYECAVGERRARNPVTGRTAILRIDCVTKNAYGGCTDYLERFESGTRKWWERLRFWRRR